MTPLVLLLSLSAIGAQAPSCHDARVQEFVAHIENVRDVKELAPLMKNPREAAACLVRQLHVVKAPVLRPEDAARRRADFRVVWSIRALRYITGGKDFGAQTKHFAELDKDRRHFLTIKTVKSEGEVSFFGVWMSRDLTYVAPRDAQEKIIEEWRKWYAAEGSNYAYRPADSADWYF